MLNLERAKELRIKRANTDWWINEKAVVAPNGMTYIAYVTDMGEIHVKELDVAPTVPLRLGYAPFEPEEHMTTAVGLTYTLDRVLRRTEEKIWRPIVPVHAQDGLPV